MRKRAIQESNLMTFVRALRFTIHEKNYQVMDRLMPISHMNTYLSHVGKTSLQIASKLKEKHDSETVMATLVSRGAIVDRQTRTVTTVPSHLIPKHHQHHVGKTLQRGPQVNE